MLTYKVVLASCIDIMKLRPGFKFLTQVRWGHWADLSSTEVITIGFTGALLGLSRTPFLLNGLMKQHV